jgi:hypothetical protein
LLLKVFTFEQKHIGGKSKFFRFFLLFTIKVLSQIRFLSNTFF